MRWECPECGRDVTDAVHRARLEQRLGAFRTFTLEPQPVHEVFVTCIEGHRAAYPETDVSARPGVGKGRPISTDESKELDDVRASLSPSSSAERIQSFATGLFTVAATIGTLGAGFNVAGPDLVGSGETVLAIAVLLAGVSLAFALAAQIPLGVEYNPNSPTNMRSQLERSLRLRLIAVLISGLLLAAALAVAGFCPLVSSTSKADTGPALVGYDVTSKGDLTVTASISGARRFSAASLQLLRIPRRERAVRLQTRARTSATGTATVKSKLKVGLRLRIVVATARWRDPNGRLETRRVRIPVR